MKYSLSKAVVIAALIFSAPARADFEDMSSLPAGAACELADSKPGQRTAHTAFGVSNTSTVSVRVVCIHFRDTQAYNVDKKYEHVWLSVRARVASGETLTCRFFVKNAVTGATVDSSVKSLTAPPGGAWAFSELKSDWMSDPDGYATYFTSTCKLPSSGNIHSLHTLQNAAGGPET